MSGVNKEELVNWGLLLLLGVIWGFSFFFIKRGLVAFDPVQVGSIRIFFAFLSFLPVIWIAGIRIPLKRMPIVALSALLGSGIPPFLFAFAQVRISSSVSGILNSLTPFFAMLIGFAVFRIPARAHHIAGVIVGLAGAVLVILLRGDGSFEFHFGYALLVVLATVFYGTNANIIKTVLRDIHPVQIALFTFVFLGPFAGVFLFTTDFVAVLRTEPKAWESLGYLAVLSVFGTSYALIVFNHLAHRTSALFATMTTYIIPMVAMLVGLADGEVLGWTHMLGLGLILTGVYISSIRKRRADVAIPGDAPGRQA